MNKILLVIILALAGCAHQNKPPQPDREKTWLINNAKGIEAINKKIVRDRI